MNSRSQVSLWIKKDSRRQQGGERNFGGNVWGRGRSSKGNSLEDKMKSPFRNASDSKRNEGPRDGEAETKLRSLGVSICRENSLSAQPRAHRVAWRKRQRDSAGGARALELRAELTRCQLANHVPAANRVALHHLAVLNLRFLILKTGLITSTPRGG